MSFSVEDEIKQEFNTWAKRAKKSKSNLFRDMVKMYKFDHELTSFQAHTSGVLAELGIKSEEELYNY